MTEPPNGGRGPSQRSAIESIEEATVEARTGGHTLGGFVRRCNSAGYGFFARCRVCRVEVAVHRTAAGWHHSLEAAACEADLEGTRTPPRNGSSNGDGACGCVPPEIPQLEGGTSTPSLSLSRPGSRVGARQTP